MNMNCGGVMLQNLKQLILKTTGRWRERRKKKSNGTDNAPDSLNFAGEELGYALGWWEIEGQGFDNH
eukprot:Gb_02720 [translate_table: standard]